MTDYETNETGYSTEWTGGDSIDSKGASKKTPSEPTLTQNRPWKGENDLL